MILLLYRDSHFGGLGDSHFENPPKKKSKPKKIRKIRE
jgi:hypothetical protein